jgi:Flp pilus assembly protein TadD
VRLALRGCVHVLNEQWADALEDLGRSYHMGLREPMQLHGLSVVLMVTGQLAQAERILHELLKLDPNHPHAAKNLAEIRSLK